MTPEAIARIEIDKKLNSVAIHRQMTNGCSQSFTMSAD